MFQKSDSQSTGFLNIQQVVYSKKKNHTIGEKMGIKKVLRTKAQKMLLVVSKKKETPARKK